MKVRSNPKARNRYLSERGPWFSKIGRCGRVTIPKPIRERFGLQAGDMVVFNKIPGTRLLRLRFYHGRADRRWTDLIERRVEKNLPA
jgi:AbrB family looped-hinge helix DNA binding protein